MKHEISFKKIEVPFADLLPNLFKVSYFNMISIPFNGNIIAAIIKFPNSESLNNSWKGINSYITANYIAHITNEYSKWNFYVFYLIGEKTEKSLKYEIENNKFSTRKIVLDEFQLDIGDSQIEEIISEHITNDNILPLSSNKTAMVGQFLKNETLSSLVEKLSLKAKQGKDEQLEDILDKLEKHLSDEI